MYSQYELLNYAKEKDRKAIEDSIRYRIYRKVLLQQGGCTNLLKMLAGAMNRIGAKLQTAAEHRENAHQQSA